MREKILINDLKVLYLCPSLKWGSLERKVIDDCRCLRDSGGSPSLFCIKGSPIDLMAEKLALPRLFYRGKKVNKFFDVTYYFDLKSVLQQNEFEIVHFYGFDFARQVCFLLRSLPQIPLILTANQTLETKMDKFWEQWLFRRIDSVLTFSEQINDFLPEYFPVPARKFLNVGCGIELIKTIKSAKAPESLVLLSFVSGPVERTSIKTLLHAFASINKLVPSARLKIVTEFDWEMVDPEQKLLLSVLELGLSDYVILSEQVVLSEQLKEADILIGLDYEEPLCVLELTAACYQLAIVAPRTAARRDFAARFPGLMKTYYWQDARELKDKILKIHQDLVLHQRTAKEDRPQLKQVHGLDTYLDRLYELYIRLFAKRTRYVSSQKK